MRTADPVSADLLPRLRAATAEQHESVERLLDIPARLADLDRYATLLRLMWGFYAPLERRLDTAVARYGVEVDWTNRRKTAWLEADLRELTGRDFPIGVEREADSLPDLPGAASVVGCLYVLEGATLGGAVIGTWLHRSHAVRAPSRFFDSYGRDRRRMWRSFAGQAGLAVRCEADVRATVRAAGATFDAFATWCRVAT